MRRGLEIGKPSIPDCHGRKRRYRERPDNDGTRPLHWAVRADELEIADLLLKAGADATAQNRLGLTALNLAATNGNGAMIRKLLDHGRTPTKSKKAERPY
jgi:ankyrin repeat protein